MKNRNKLNIAPVLDDLNAREQLNNKKSVEKPYMVYSAEIGNALLHPNENVVYEYKDHRNMNRQQLHNQFRDVNQYFGSSYHSLIQLDEKLCIKTFTSTVKNQVNIRESDIGRPISDLTNMITNLDLVLEVRKVMDTYKTVYKQAKSNKGKWYSLLIEPISDKNHIVGVNIAFHDTTRLTLTKLQAERDNEKLQRINKDHENFIYSVTHDLKSPLNSMEALVTLINRTDDVKSIKELTNPLMKSVEGLRQTISELSNIADLEKDLNGSESVLLAPLMEEIKWSLNDLLTNSYAILKIDFQVNEISFSRKNLRSIIYNFLCNAIKYKSNNRQLKIEIKTKIQGKFVVLSVSDNGIGISKDQVESIFSKFKRISDGEDIEGSGIGLFLVNRIVSNAGGDIKVQSELGKGTTFEVHIPMKETQQIE